MKKLSTVVLSIVLTAGIAFTASAADLSRAGIIGEEGVPIRFVGKEDLITRRFKDAYQWATTLHSYRPYQGYFDFGESSDELVHTWGNEKIENSYTIVCQDFFYGTSTCSSEVLAERWGWASLICTNAETLEVFVLRDAPAELYLNLGGVNNRYYGDPTSNQYWRMERGIPVLYQQFTKGYLRIEEGSIENAEFHLNSTNGSYEAPPAAPPAYGAIYKPNEDGCTWENPLYTPRIPLGDMDWSGQISIGDAMELCKVLARKAAGIQPTADELKQGDLDHNDTIDIADVMELCKALARQK